MNRLLSFILIIPILLACKTQNKIDKEESKALKRTEAFWTDLRNGKTLVGFFDTNQFSPEDLDNIAKRFLECNIAKADISYLATSIIEESTITRYEFKYFLDMECGRKYAFITFNKSNTEDIVGFHVTTAK